MKKSSKSSRSSKNIRTSKKIRKHIRKMRGGVDCFEPVEKNGKFFCPECDVQLVEDKKNWNCMFHNYECKYNTGDTQEKQGKPCGHNTPCEYKKNQKYKFY